MANRWTIDEDVPDKTDKYNWHVPHTDQDQQHVEQTTVPGDLRLKPSDITLKPTMAPKQSGIQHGWSNWTFEVDPPSAWYVYGQIIQEDD